MEGGADGLDVVALKERLASVDWLVRECLKRDAQIEELKQRVQHLEKELQQTRRQQKPRMIDKECHVTLMPEPSTSSLPMRGRKRERNANEVNKSDSSSLENVRDLVSSNELLSPPRLAMHPPQLMTPMRESSDDEVVFQTSQQLSKSYSLHRGGKAKERMPDEPSSSNKECILLKTRTLTSESSDDEPNVRGGSGNIASETSKDEIWRSKSSTSTQDTHISGQGTPTVTEEQDLRSAQEKRSYQVSGHDVKVLDREVNDREFSNDAFNDPPSPPRLPSPHSSDLMEKLGEETMLQSHQNIAVISNDEIPNSSNSLSSKISNQQSTQKGTTPKGSWGSNTNKEVPDKDPLKSNVNDKAMTECLQYEKANTNQELASSFNNNSARPEDSDLTTKVKYADSRANAEAIAQETRNIDRNRDQVFPLELEDKAVQGTPGNETQGESLRDDSGDNDEDGFKSPSQLVICTQLPENERTAPQLERPLNVFNEEASEKETSRDTEGKSSSPNTIKEKSTPGTQVQETRSSRKRPASATCDLATKKNQPQTITRDVDERTVSHSPTLLSKTAGIYNHFVRGVSDIKRPRRQPSDDNPGITSSNAETNDTVEPKQDWNATLKKGSFLAYLDREAENKLCCRRMEMETRLRRFKEPSKDRAIASNHFKTQLGRLWGTLDGATFANIVLQFTGEHLVTYDKTFFDVVFSAVREEKHELGDNFPNIGADRSAPSLSMKQRKLIALLHALSKNGSDSQNILTNFTNYLFFYINKNRFMTLVPLKEAVSIVKFYLSLLRLNGDEIGARCFLFDIFFFGLSRKHVYFSLLLEIWPEIARWNGFAVGNTEVDPLVETVLYMVFNTGPKGFQSEMMIGETRRALGFLGFHPNSIPNASQLVIKFIKRTIAMGNNQVVDIPNAVDKNLRNSVTMSLALLATAQEPKWVDINIQSRLLDQMKNESDTNSASERREANNSWIAQTMGILVRANPHGDRDHLLQLLESMMAMLKRSQSESYENACLQSIVRIAVHHQVQAARFLDRWRPEYEVWPNTKELLCNFVATKGRRYCSMTLDLSKNKNGRGRGNQGRGAKRGVRYKGGGNSSRGSSRNRSRGRGRGRGRVKM